MTRTSWLSLALLCATACGGSTSQESTYGSARAEPVSQPFELSLRDGNNEPFTLADFRGRSVLLFLFATFDLPSQAALEPLQAFAREHPEIETLGIALQPDPQDLLNIFADALQLEITLAYEADNRLLQGLTDLGRIDGVPTYVLVDRHGHITKRWTGPLNASALRHWCGFE